MKSIPAPFILLSILAASRATAALLGFEAVDGYSLNDIKTGGVIVEGAGIGGSIGPEVHLYSAGDGNGLHTDIPNNTGRFRNIYGAGATGDFLGAGAPGDTTYLSAHQASQSGASVRPAGYDSGAQVLALRTDAKPYTDPNDGPHNAKYAYTVDSLDLNGLSPSAVGNSVVTIGFYTCVSTLQTYENGGAILSTTNNLDFRSLEMGFGGVNGDAARIGWTDENTLAYYNATTNAWIDTNLLFNYQGYDGVSMSIDTATNTWSLAINRSLNSTAYATETVFTNQPLFSTIGSTFGDITFTAIEDPDDGDATKNGLAKTYFDNFAFTVVPEPSAALLGLIGCLGLLRRRR